MRIAQLQTHVWDDPDRCLAGAEEVLSALDGQRPDLVCLGEMFACPYETAAFPRLAQPTGGPTWRRRSAMAAEHHETLSAGTVPEVDADGHVYNTAYVFGPDGSQLARFRKMHLFDVDIPGGQRFRESDTLTAGDQVVTFATGLCRMGVCVCFDCRFPELVRLMALRGAQVILVPAAFNLSTGPAPWELLHRSNALAAQCFVVATSVARDMRASYHAWGHSMVVSPWGQVLAEAAEGPCAQVVDVDLGEVARARQALPTLCARRSDVYDLRELPRG